MPRRKKHSAFSFFTELSEGTRHGIYGVVLLVIALFFGLASFGQAGVAGEAVYNALYGFLGLGFYLVPIVVLILSLAFFRAIHNDIPATKFIGSFFFFFSGLATLAVINPAHGGTLGGMIANPLIAAVDTVAGLIILLGILVASILVTFNAELHADAIFFWRKRDDKDDDPIIIGSTEEDEDDEEEYEEEDEEEGEAEEETDEDEEEELDINEGEEIEEGSGGIPFIDKEFALPPLSLLSKDKGKPGVGDIKANANIIKRTLQNFGITVEMDEISVGPSVTRYALKPAEGVKLSRIVGLQNDLSLALAAHPLRIEAPIPGKALVGIEIPNSTKTTVGLGTLLGSTDYQESDKPLLAALGKGISGSAHFANIAKMPHLLIAGTTGSGKSVTIHALITSLLYRNTPETLRMIMVDPKRVEMTLYNKIPHLLTPVITDAKKAILSLKWAIKEMERRYDILEAESVRDLHSYHENIYKPALAQARRQTEKDPDAQVQVPEPMPYIVFIIDELADIMQAYPRELEAGIVRLAQMSRAVGIHLVLSTQRPSVNVITGLIKANVPSRIALQVASQIDSRTILDTSGAEKLLGAGDMLYLSGEISKPHRVQSAFITETEVKRVVKFLKDTYRDEPPSEITLTNESTGGGALFSAAVGDDDDDEDDLYETAREEVIKAGKASTSYIQRKLRVGYARAARLMDMLEERGVIGPAEGAKPREVLDQGSDEEEEYEEDIPETETDTEEYEEEESEDEEYEEEEEDDEEER